MIASVLVTFIATAQSVYALPCSASDLSLKRHIEAFYVAYVEQYLGPTDEAWYVTLGKILPLAPQLLRLVEAEELCEQTPQVCEIDFDPILNAQDWSPDWKNRVEAVWSAKDFRAVVVRQEIPGRANSRIKFLLSCRNNLLELSDLVYENKDKKDQSPVKRLSLSQTLQQSRMVGKYLSESAAARAHMRDGARRARYRF